MMCDSVISLRVGKRHNAVRPTTLRLTATANQLSALVAAFGLTSFAELEAEFIVTPYRDAGVSVHGRFHAVLEQTCVVTLKSVPTRIDRNFMRYFLPQHMLTPENEHEIIVDMNLGDPPDLLCEDGIDLGEILCEELALALDPFPRAAEQNQDPFSAGQDATVWEFGDNAQPDQETSVTGPFAQLANRLRGQI